MYGGRRFWKLLLVPFPGTFTPGFSLLGLPLLSQDLALSPPQTSSQCSWACTLSLPPHGGGEPEPLCSRECGTGVSLMLRETRGITWEKGGQSCTWVWMVWATPHILGACSSGCLSGWETLRGADCPACSEMMAVPWSRGHAADVGDTRCSFSGSATFQLCELGQLPSPP